MVPRAQLIGTSPRQLRARAQAGAERAKHGLAWRPLIGSTGARAAARSGGGAGDARRAHAGSLPAVQGVQSRSAAAVQTARVHRGTRLGRTQSRAMLRAMGAGSPAARSAFGLRAGAPQPLPATRPRLPSPRFASWSPRGTLWRPSLPAPLHRSAAEAPGLRHGRPAGRRDEHGGAGTQAGAQEAGSPARPPRWAERPAPAPSAGVTRGRRLERAGRSPVLPGIQGAACSTRPPASASGLLGTKVEPPVHLLLQHPKLLPPTVRSLET